MTKRKNYSIVFTRRRLGPGSSRHWMALSAVFSEKAAKPTTGYEEEIKTLHAKIGQLTVEKDFLERAFAKFPGSRGTK